MRRSQGYNYQPLPQNAPSTSNDALEEENERMAEELKGKIGALKTLTIDIGNEVRHQDRLLAGMDDDMESTFGVLKNTMGRVLRLGKGGHRNYMCYMFLFVLGILLLLYVVLKFR
uniref:BET1 homolog n=1 Tax=Nyssomyia neivai TaxID=330878 RepID=A0A1L8DA37_9DIPT